MKARQALCLTCPSLSRVSLICLPRAFATIAWILLRLVLQHYQEISRVQGDWQISLIFIVSVYTHPHSSIRQPLLLSPGLCTLAVTVYDCCNSLLIAAFTRTVHSCPQALHEALCLVPLPIGRLPSFPPKRSYMSQVDRQHPAHGIPATPLRCPC